MILKRFRVYAPVVLHLFRTLFRIEEMKFQTFYYLTNGSETEVQLIVRTYSMLWNLKNKMILAKCLTTNTMYVYLV